MAVNFWKDRYGRVRFRFVDIVCVAYLLIIALFLVFFHKNVSRWPFIAVLNVVVVFGILEIVRLGEAQHRRKIFWILRTFYPIAVLLFTWGELDAVIPMFFGRYWATDAVIRLERQFFGGYPNVWMQQFYRPWLDELMNVLYAGYYLFMPVISLTLFVRKKYEAVLAAFSIGTFTYLTNYILFFAFPTLAPNVAEAFRGLDMGSWSGYVMADLTRFLQWGGSSRGATFPSSHISGVFVWTFAALRYHRPLGYGLLPLAFGVAMSTIYLGYHYGVDPVFGCLWAVVCFPVALKIIQARKEDPVRQGE
jgi:membrane-associated phospholipid phosphatase